MYRVKKAICHYSLVDLLEIIMNKEHSEYQEALKEFNCRTITDKEMEIAKKGLKIRLKLRNKPLSLIDKINCFLVPIIAKQRPFTEWYTEMNLQYENDMDEFRYFGETRRIEELKKWQKYARNVHLFYLPLIALIVLLVVLLIRK